MAETRSPKVLVTGCSGFVGGHLVAALRDRVPEVEVVGTTHGVAGALDGTVRMVPLDVTDRAATEAVVAAERPDAVVHLAALSHVTDSAADPTRTLSVNLLGTLNLADAVLDHAPEARFLFVGSSEAYGRTLARWDRPLDEDAPFAPNNPYATSKAAADLLVGELAARRGLRAVRFRPFNHTGPGQDARFVVPAFARQIARIEAGAQEPVVRVGDLTARREFLDVRDVVRAYADAALRPEPMEGGLALNLATGRPVTIRSVLDTLIGLSGASIRVERDPNRMRPPEAGYAGGDASAAAALGWRATVPLETTLAAVLDSARHGRSG